MNQVEPIVSARALELCRRAEALRWRAPAASYSAAKRAASGSVMDGAAMARLMSLTAWHEKWRGDFAACRQVAEAGLAALPDHGDGGVKAELLAALACHEIGARRVDHAAALLERAHRSLSSDGPPRHQIEVLSSEAFLHRLRGDREQALTTQQAALTIAERADDAGNVARIRWARARVRADHDDIGAATEAEEALRLAEADRNLVVSVLAHEVLGAARLKAGDLAGAEAAVRSGRDKALALGAGFALRRMERTLKEIERIRAKGQTPVAAARRGARDLAAPSTGAAPDEAPAPLALIVEDNTVNSKFLEAALASIGMTVVSAGSGADGLSALAPGGAAEQCDVILSDLHMPGMSGFEFISRVRDILKSSAPIVAVSADVTLDARQAATSAGADAFLAKPVRIADLQATLARLLDD